MYEYTAWGLPSTRDPLGVVDGDTLNVGIDLGLDIAHNTILRLYGINAPEIETQAGKDAKAWAIEWFQTNCPTGQFFIQTVKDNKDKYGRYLADVFSADPALNEAARWYNQDIVNAGHAVIYYAGTKPDPNVPDPINPITGTTDQT